MRTFFGILYYIVVAFGACGIGTVYTIGRKIMRKDGHDYTHICCSYFPPVFKLFGIKLEVEGKENIPENSGYIIACNHQSFLDINVIFAAVSFTSFWAKESLWHVPVFGWIMKNTGSVPIYRNDPKKNAGIGKVMQDRIAHGYNICVFPEGTRSKDGIMKPFKNGIFRALSKYPVKILPVTLIGTGKVLPPKQGLKIFPGPVKVVIHKPIMPEDYEGKTMEELRDGVHDLIEAAMPYKNNQE